MSHIDTLKNYDDLINSGVHEKEARAHINALDKSFDNVVTKDYLDSKLRLLYILGTAIFTVCCLPILDKFLK